MNWLRRRIVAWLWPDIHEQVQLKLIAWREGGNFLNYEQKQQLKDRENET